jgi:chromosome partitioning protein
MDYDLPDGGASPEGVEDLPPSPSTAVEPPGSTDSSAGPEPDLPAVPSPAPGPPDLAAAAPAEAGTSEHALDVPADLAPVEDLITEGEPASAARPLPRVMAIANQKGGVGKTTTAVNLGACLAELGFRTLVVDLDPQGNASTGLGINTRALEASMYDVLLGETPMEDCIEGSSVRNLFVAPASLDLAGAEIELVPAFSRELRLRNAIDSVKEDYDYVLIDCPPSLGLLTINAFAAATEVLVPIQCEYYALEGLGQLVRNVDLVKRNLNDSLEISTIILVMYDARTKLADQVATEVREHFGEKVCRQIVPRTVRLSEAPSFGQPIITFDPSSRGAIAYRQLAKEVSGGPS